MAMQLDKLVIIERRGPDVDTAGQRKPTWNKSAPEWASIRPVSARRMQNASGARAEVTHEIIMRAGTKKIKGKDRIRYGERLFDVIAPINVDERDRYINLLSKENAD